MVRAESVDAKFLKFHPYVAIDDWWVKKFNKRVNVGVIIFCQFICLPVNLFVRLFALTDWRWLRTTVL